MPNKCHAPCIINTAIGFQLVFCEQEHGHAENHSLKMKSGKEVTASWNYIGVAVDGGVSGAPGLDERCTTWVYVDQPPQLAPGVLAPMYQMSLMTVTESSVTTGFCCEKSPGHEGCHMRTGAYGPLGTVWKIEW